MKDPNAVKLGQKSAKKRFEGKTPEQISVIMKDIRAHAIPREKLAESLFGKKRG